ncbi:aminoglycoside phosphotransferase family protein [Umezawaea sp. Da 62-37]|uniref:phosphotransferase family protein n=1 Tax=Umezawaea sp. Da 62-37 TaxID=3075927 RepID=UPI0028F74433|nr:aminoglycoside phosphotransferase family protein [Umezawaea sp. Da 62-37]WNV84989.1 aminoglycoside phosphotransferase family protein [Umezawaea sp. Da 62-37]
MGADTVPVHLREWAAREFGAVASWRRVEGGYSAATRYVVTAEAGRSVFVKAASDELTAGWLRREHEVLSGVCTPIAPTVLGWLDGPLPLLALEDLSAGEWPPPWRAGLVAGVVGLLAELHSHHAPAHLPRLVDDRDVTEGWEVVSADPEPLLALGIVDRDWVTDSLDVLRAAAAAAPLDGGSLLHCDVRSDNIVDLGGRTVLIDWDRCAIGNPLFDLAFWAPSLQVEGGPEPERVVGRAPELASLVAGFFAARAWRPPPRPGSTVRGLQLAQLRSALPWAARELGLAPPW